MPDRIESLLAVAIDNIADLQAEVRALRDRIHRLESTVRGVEHLAKEVRALHDSLPNLARQSAREAVTEYLKRRQAERFTAWRTYAAVASVGIAFGALIVALVLR